MFVPFLALDFVRNLVRVNSFFTRHCTGLLSVSLLLLNSCGGGSVSVSFPGPGPGPSASTEGVVIVGQTSSTNFPLSAGTLVGQFLGGSMDGYIASVNLPNSSNSSGQIRFATYFGGSDFEQVRDIALDSSGNIYVTGRTLSRNLPSTSGAFQSTFRGGPMDGYVAKFSSTGQLVFCTYLGGSVYDVGYSISVDAAGFIYVSGSTSSPDFPVTAGAFQTVYGGGQPGQPAPVGFDAFVVKMKPDGSGLVWGTFVGGSKDDTGRGRHFLDASGAIYVEGSTQSSNFPTTPNAAQRVLHGSEDAFVAKLASDGSRLLFGTYLGGVQSVGESASGGIAVNAQGEAFVCGDTTAADFPATTAALKKSLSGSTDSFVAHLDANGGLLAATLLGGSSTEFCQGVVLDSLSRPIVLGVTRSFDFPTTPVAYQTTFGGGTGDFTVSKLSLDLSSLLFSTYIGGSGSEAGDTLRVDVDASGNIVFVGSTDSSAFPVTAGAIQTLYHGGTSDAVVVKLSADGSRLLFSTFLGGGSDDFPRSIRYRPN